MSPNDYILIYVNHIDISAPSGAGINEREMIRALLRACGSRVRYVGPTPRYEVELPSDKMITWPWRRSIIYQVVFELWLAMTLWYVTFAWVAVPSFEIR